MTDFDKKYQDLIEASEAVIKEMQRIIIIQKELKKEFDAIATNLTLDALERGYSFEEIERVKNGGKI